MINNAAARWLTALLAAAVSMALASCSTIPASPAQPSTATKRAAMLTALNDWSLDGRVAVSDGGEGWQASVRWQQQAERYSINLVGPFGQGQAVVAGGPQGVSLKSGDKVLTAADPESLIAQTAGAPLPISGLKYWIRGLPQPDAAAQPSYDPQGRLTFLRQDGWIIEYLNYVQINGFDLPQRMRATQDKLKVKVVVQKWEV